MLDYRQYVFFYENGCGNARNIREDFHLNYIREFLDGLRRTRKGVHTCFSLRVTAKMRLSVITALLVL